MTTELSQGDARALLLDFRLQAEPPGAITDLDRYSMTLEPWGEIPRGWRVGTDPARMFLVERVPGEENRTLYIRAAKAGAAGVFITRSGW
jgi:hypothetical protein